MCKYNNKTYTPIPHLQYKTENRSKAPTGNRVSSLPKSGVWEACGASIAGTKNLKVPAEAPTVKSLAVS